MLSRHNAIFFYYARIFVSTCNSITHPKPNVYLIMVQLTQIVEGKKMEGEQEDICIISL